MRWFHRSRSPVRNTRRNNTRRNNSPMRSPLRNRLRGLLNRRRRPTNARPNMRNTRTQSQRQRNGLARTHAYIAYHNQQRRMANLFRSREPSLPRPF